MMIIEQYQALLRGLHAHRCFILTADNQPLPDATQLQMMQKPHGPHADRRGNTRFAA